MSFPRHRSIWIALLLTVASTLQSCAHGERRGRWSRQLDGRIWARAAGETLTDPVTALPLAATTGAMFAGFLRDDDVRAWAQKGDNPEALGGRKDRYDTSLHLVGGAAIAYAIGHWIAGDSGQQAQVLFESTLLTEATVFALKRIVGRGRPDGVGKGSFPSSHSSAAFTAATFLARSVQDQHDSSLGYLAYLPAIYTATGRMGRDRHYLSDVAGGALIAMFFTNTIYNAHFGEGGIYDEPARPIVEEDFIGLTFPVRF